jgi:hypothetical protein
MFTITLFWLFFLNHVPSFSAELSQLGLHFSHTSSVNQMFFHFSHSQAGDSRMCVPFPTLFCGVGG